jgi:hypothetical protein
MPMIESLFNTDGEHLMLDNATIDNLTKDARPVDFRTLRSYIRWAPSVAYVRREMVPSLRRLDPAIWKCVRSGSSKT